MTTSLVWFRRDARLGDNPAWAEATYDNLVCPLFVIDPRLFDVVSPRRRSLLVGGLRALDRSLSEAGGRLRVEMGDPGEVVPRVAAEVGAGVVHVNREVTPFGVSRDTVVERHIPLHQSEGNYIHPPGSLLSTSGEPYRVFTPFYQAWSQTPVPVTPQAGDARIASNPGVELPAVDPASIEPGEVAAMSRLDNFATKIDDYEEQRDFPGTEGTSRLSIDVKYGWIGPREVATRLAGQSPGRRAFIRQLAWRDFYAGLLFASPETVSTEMKPAYRRISWRDDPNGLAAWKKGQTGYPIVDAGMRQLSSEGWMHNRVRLITASFLVKDLLIDWRLGERHFRRLLLDADVAQNVGNWQWVAGTGSDAAPYFRVFNPVTQSRRFDPDGTYIRRWVPEIAGLPSSHIHEPWTLGPMELSAHGVELGVTYPDPVIDHQDARRRAIEVYRRAVS